MGFKAELIDNQYQELALKLESLSMSHVIFETDGDTSYQDLLTLLDEEGQAEFKCSACRKFIDRVANLVYFIGETPRAYLWRHLEVKDEALRAKLKLLALRVELSVVTSVFWNKGGKLVHHPGKHTTWYQYTLGNDAREPYEHFHTKLWVPPLVCLREYVTLEREFMRLTCLMDLAEQVRLLNTCIKVTRELMPFTQNIQHNLIWTRNLLKEIHEVSSQLSNGGRNTTAKLLARVIDEPSIQTMVDKFYALRKEHIIDMLETAMTNPLEAVLTYLAVTDPANFNIYGEESRVMATRIHQMHALRNMGVHEALTFHHAELDELYSEPECIWKRSIDGLDKEEYKDIPITNKSVEDFRAYIHTALSFQLITPFTVGEVKRIIVSNLNTELTPFTWQDDGHIALIDSKCQLIQDSLVEGPGHLDVQAIIDDGYGEIYFVVSVDTLPVEVDLSEMLSTLKPEYDHYRMGVEELLHVTKANSDKELVAIPLSQFSEDQQFVYYVRD